MNVLRVAAKKSRYAHIYDILLEKNTKTEFLRRTGHYLSPGGDHLIFGRKKGGSVVTENSKAGGSRKTLEGFSGVTTQFCLENEEMVGGIVKIIKTY